MGTANKPEAAAQVSTMRRDGRASSVLMLACAALLGGCASQGVSGEGGGGSQDAAQGADVNAGVERVELVVPADRYREAFQAARDALREAQFTLDRVDASRGRITTFARAGEGAARPWAGLATTDSPLQDVIQRQQRSVRVAFVPASQVAVDPRLDDPSLNLLDLPVATRLIIETVVERVERPGRRAQFDAVRLTSQTLNPELESRGLVPRYSVPVREDRVLAEWLAGQIASRVGLGGQE
jgi:hypothetical protein